MVIIAKTTLEKFSSIHKLAAEPLNTWYKIVKQADWRNFSDMRTTFNSVDNVGNDRYCFNIKGNDFRLIALILFKTRTVFILWFGTHAEYDKLSKTTGAGNVTHNK